MITLSTGHKYQMFSGIPIVEIYENSVILLYASAKPEKPEDPPGGSPIARVTAGGGDFVFGSPTNGLNWILSTAGYLLPSTDNWILTGISDGTLLWGRMCQNDDSGMVSFAEARFDFDVNSIDGYGASITNPDIAAAEQRAVDFSIYGIPPL